MIPWYVYIVECADKSLYVGITTDVRKRVHRHNMGKGGKYTRAKRPVVLVHKEKMNNRSHALRREAEIKSWPRAKKLLLIQSK